MTKSFTGEIAAWFKLPNLTPVDNIYYYYVQRMKKYPQQDCIPVGCIPTAAVTANRRDVSSEVGGGGVSLS